MIIEQENTAPADEDAVGSLICVGPFVVASGCAGGIEGSRQAEREKILVSIQRMRVFYARAHHALRWYNETMARNVSVTTRRLGEVENPMRAADDLSPAERIALVWELTSQALVFQGGTDAQQRLSRHIVRTLGGGS